MIPKAIYLLPQLSKFLSDAGAVLITVVFVAALAVVLCVATVNLALPVAVNIQN